ncbi:alpha-2-macroglobulin family protein [Aureispira anguillae]|uniref:MG2 domain-containing protein n=1 Tax=Aureispira anguillae TaxID=2864201 RepID=A0A915VML4_9BACT|nr:MG2 domain-containing protein [Aureispira anguillae]BDS09685.1 MG2 domain-containing protein [Aureispira anguillae]
MNTTKLSGLFFALAFVFGACTTEYTPTKVAYNQAYDEYLSAFTSGEISKKSTIRVVFQNELTTTVNAPIYPNPFSFEPVLEGEAVWSDKQTIEFIPKGDLTSGQIYTAQLNLSKLLPNLSSDLANFTFQFKAKDQFINVSPLASTVTKDKNNTWMELEGELTTHDVEDVEGIEKVLTAYDGDRPLKINWKHQNGKKHRFSIENVQQKAKAYPITWKWNGKPLNSKTIGEYSFNIPPEGDFMHTNTYRYNSPEQHIILEFSDLLDTEQNLEGLVQLAGKNIKYAIEENKIKLFTDGNLLGKKQLKISGEIKSTFGKKLGSPLTETITFSDTKPKVEWLGKGNIIPKSKKMPVVFKTVNLNAVDVRVIKVKEKNIKQFFQVNRIDGDSELKRVGTVVLEKKIALDKTKGLNLSEWTNHSLDLADLITPELGAVYEIALGFSQSYSLYPCEASDAEEGHYEAIDMMDLPKNWDSPNYSSSYWDNYDDDYDYGDLNNPCSRYYYRPNLVAKRNILASDLGIIAKQGDNGSLFVVNNLQTTEPLKSVELEFYDYHQELIGTAKTDKEGMASPSLAKKPFFLIAKLGDQRGYLRLDDGSALSMSRFDVAGSTYHKGLKGFIYGERGVWRPGDELFLNFILEDKDKTLPANHPVVFTLKDSRGSIVVKKTSTKGVNGIYNFTCQTDEEAPTGNYLATVRVGGAKFSKNIKVEAIKPNRLKMDLDFGVKELSVENKSLEGRLTSTWLHGAVAKNLKAKVEVTLSEGKTKFVKYSEYAFHDPAREFSPEDKVIFEDKLDENGKATVKTTIAANRQGPGMLKANFRMKVFEPGGDFSISQFSMPYHPYKTYVGVRIPKGDEARNMLLTDVKHDIEIVALDKDGELVDEAELEVKLYKLEWKWWFDKNRDEVSSYRGKVYGTEVTSGKVSTKNGKATWQMEVKYPNWGRYLVRVSNGKTGHSTGKVFYIDWPGWAGRSTENDPGGATALNFTADAKKYKVGDEITLNIPTGQAGRALVSIENGTKIVEAHWVETQKGATQFKFKATAAMAPNAYASVSLLQPHAQTKNDLPIRMYGAIPLKVEDPSTHLEPEMVIPDELRPGQEFAMSVKERKGGPMAYTIAIVDEGLLDLTRFKTPSPWNTFYKREALGVKTWDMYNDVLGAFGGDVKSLLSIGGDGAAADRARKKPDRFKPVVIYLGPFYLKEGETANHKFTMPNYVGSVRAMVVAANDGAYGSTEKAIPVRQPLMVLGTVPRVLGVGESFKLPVTVFAMKENIKNVDVKVETSGLIDVAGKKTGNVTFKEPGNDLTYFELLTRYRVGAGHIKITVSSGKESATYETDVIVRNANPRETLVAHQTLEDKQSWKQTYKPIGMMGTNHGVMEVSSIPPMNLGKRLKYLIRYPYGCVEQTTSSVFPQVYLTALMDLPEQKKEKITTNIKAGIKRLYRYQNPSGAMAYWPGQADDLWATNYAGHFMIEAKKAGYTVTDEFMKAWIAFQTSTAQKWTAKGTVSDDLTQAYRLFLLALAGKPDLGSMNRMRLKQSKAEAVAARWYLAAAYHMAGQKEVAKTIATKAVLTALPYKGSNAASTFGSQFRDQALILQALSIMNLRNNANDIVKTISDKLASDNWLNTQETAQALVAMAKFVGEGGVSRKVTFEYRLADGSWQKVNSNKPIWQLELKGNQATEVSFKNTSGAVLFTRLISDGIPAAMDETETAKGLDLTVVYMDMAGEKLDPTLIAQGTDFKAQVTVKNTGNIDYNELAIHQIFPSGWEIHNTRLTGATTGGDKAEYVDIRDDRVYTFFDLKKGKSKTFNVLLNASYLGRYYLPALAVEAMYDKTIQARKRGQWVEVNKRAKK